LQIIPTISRAPFLAIALFYQIIIAFKSAYLQNPVFFHKIRLLMKVAFIATRISGLDGVSLEIDNWGKVFSRMGHKTLFVAGQLDREGVLLPELHFQNPEVAKLYRWIVESKRSFEKVEVKVFEMAGRIEGLLRRSLGNGVLPDLLVVSNVFSLPMHFPFAVGLARFIEEYKIPTIARHHDFWWERERFLNSKCFNFFKRWFPPDLPYVKHVTINSIAQRELFERTGIKSELVWDSFDFSSDIKLDKYASHFRDDFGINPGDIVFLQATRIVPRKRLEIAIELVRRLNNPRIVLVFAGHSGDEGYLYLKKVKQLAYKAPIRCKFIGRFVNSRRRVVDLKTNNHSKRRRVYTLWDCYLNSDFVVYPTEKEGFGNQFVESVFFKKPLILTPYPVYKKDIKPLGFKAIEIDDKLKADSVKKVEDLLNNKYEVERIVSENFKLGKKYLSYDWVESKIRKILKDI